MSVRLLVLLAAAMIAAAAADSVQPRDDADAVRAQPRADRADVAVSVYESAEELLERGELTQALAQHERALAQRTKTLRADAPQIADSLDGVAATLIQLERFPAARQHLQRALAIREARATQEPLALARTLEQLCWLHRYGGDYHDARAPFGRLLALRRELAADHPDMARTRLLEGDLLYLEGDSGGALQAWRAGMASIERQLGPEHPSLVGFQRRLEFLHEALGERAEAERLVQAGLRIATQSLASCNWDRLGIGAAAADLRAYDGAYVESRARYRRLLVQCEQCLGARHSSTATVIYNLALLARSMGDFAEAERLLDRATRTWSAGLGPNHPYVARGWEGLGDVAADRGLHVRARELYLRALAARRGAATPSPPLIASTLTSLARTLMESGDLRTATRHVEEALSLYDKGRTEDPDAVPRALSLSGEIHLRRGDPAAARAAFASALSHRERAFGEQHPLTAQARVGMAATELALSDPRSALQDALSAEAAGRDHLRFTIRYLPERQALHYAASRPRGLDVAISTAAATSASAPPESGARLVDAVIRSRGVLLEELALRTRAERVPDAATAPLMARAAAARQRYANLVVLSLRESVPRARLDEARQEKEDAEQALAERSASAGAEIARAEAGLDAVRAALPSDAALVSFVRYDRTIVGAARWQAPTPSYAAFVLHPDVAEPVLVPLGSAAAIDARVAAWRDQASGRTLVGSTPREAERAYRLAGLRLRRAIWDPLATALAGATRIFIVPDGQLNVVNFAALPASAGHFLADEPVLLHYVSTERDLAMPAATAASSGLLAVGGATFDGQTMTPETTAARSACEEFSRMRFPALPGSRREVVDITRTWPDASAPDVTVLSGAAATETAVKRAAAGRRVVHLATHGFFLGGECIPGVSGTRGVGGLARRPAASASDTDNPLLLSGLALAWANRRDKARTSEDDGILTAEEIAGLNLQGTEWAVLSACDTGLGEIKAGEGVFGLRRAFQVAGARTVIMSLWSVEDTSARVWMRALYDGRFRQQRSTSDAVREASRTVLAARRARGQSTHPFFWAGFVAAGDWR
jgi:CHAT domain-containing protein/tetratricopeptide (TPR) repeat protein